MPDTLNVFHPYQPFFEIPDDLYVEKRDSKKAVNSIALFYQFMIGDGKTDQLFAVPDGCIDMIFRCDTDDPKAKVCGTVVKARKVNFEPGIEYFGVRLLPGNSMNLFDLSANDLVDKEVQLSDILKDNGKLIESIAEAGRFEKRIDCFFNYFVNNLSASKQMPLLLRYLIKRMLETSGQIKIEDLATETGYTARYVQKVFVEYIGISPKLFSRVIRFQKSLDYIFSNTSLDIYQMVYELGYYDHAHFIHEFKEFCLFSPSQIIHNKRDYSGILGLRNV